MSLYLSSSNSLWATECEDSADLVADGIEVSLSLSLSLFLSRIEVALHLPPSLSIYICLSLSLPLSPSLVLALSGPLDVRIGLMVSQMALRSSDLNAIHQVARLQRHLNAIHTRPQTSMSDLDPRMALRSIDLNPILCDINFHFFARTRVALVVDGIEVSLSLSLSLSRSLSLSLSHQGRSLSLSLSLCFFLSLSGPLNVRTGLNLLRMALRASNLNPTSILGDI